MLRGIANFWCTKAKPAPDRLPASDAAAVPPPKAGQWVIHSVMPPDEYHQLVNNSAYTNAVAQLSLEFAVSAAAVLAGAGIATNATAAELSLWKKVAARLWVPFDEQTQWHPEFEGYENGTTIKQADVILMGFPLQYNMSLAVRKNDLDVYARVTSQRGPAMTWSMFAIGYMDVGDADKAYSNFLRGYANVHPPFDVWRETPDGEDGAINFLTGAGGFLQSVLSGYGGVRVQGTLADGLLLNPPPPPSAARKGAKMDPAASAFIVHGVDFLGSSLRVRSAATDITVEVLKAAPAGVALHLMTRSSVIAALKVGQPVTFDYNAHGRQPLFVSGNQ
jgi:hypothetical protein